MSETPHQNVSRGGMIGYLFRNGTESLFPVGHERRTHVSVVDHDQACLRPDNDG